MLSALAESIPRLDRTKVNRILFDNCGIADGQMAQILKAFTRVKELKSIIYKKNEFSSLSIQ